MRQNLGRLQGGVSGGGALRNRKSLYQGSRSRNWYGKTQEKGRWKGEELGLEFQEAGQRLQGSLEQQEGAGAEEPE